MDTLTFAPARAKDKPIIKNVATTLLQFCVCNLFPFSTVRPLPLLDFGTSRGRTEMRNQMFGVIGSEEGQDIAEYAVMLAVILVVGTIRLVGSNANNVFSQVASSIR